MRLFRPLDLITEASVDYLVDRFIGSGLYRWGERGVYSFRTLSLDRLPRFCALRGKRRPPDNAGLSRYQVSLSHLNLILSMKFK